MTDIPKRSFRQHAIMLLAKHENGELSADEVLAELRDRINSSSPRIVDVRIEFGCNEDSAELWAWAAIEVDSDLGRIKHSVSSRGKNGMIDWELCPLTDEDLRDSAAEELAQLQVTLDALDLTPPLPPLPPLDEIDVPTVQ